jgi:diguanylate cyclase (GGDEF)-like protein
MQKNKTLLIVEDNPADSTHLVRLLETVEHEFTDVQTTSTVSETRVVLEDINPSFILLDCKLVDGDALDVIKIIECNNNISACPIIVITGSEDTSNAVMLMKQGVMDYLIKPLPDAKTLIRAIKTAQNTWELQQEINYLALHDSLTGLVNRNLFLDRLALLFESYQRTNIIFSLIYLDLDDFKQINDMFGHAAGDYLLTKLASRLLMTLRKTDTAARLGGDEFALILPATNEEQAVGLANKLIREISGNIKWENQLLSLKFSIGLTTISPITRSTDDIMREADFALYQSKQKGRNISTSFDISMETQINKKRLLKHALPNAIDATELIVVYQPIYNSETNEPTEVEALIRWNLNGEWVNPELIIQSILSQQLSEKFHRFLFNESLKQLKQWKKESPSLKMALNFPASLISSPVHFSLLQLVLANNQLSFSDIIIEITETEFMENTVETSKQLRKLEECRAEIAIDDFGTGYSAMKYLVDLPCQQLKIDKSFFLNMDDNPNNEKIIAATIALAKSLNLQIVAEGIETDSMVRKANELGCTKLQGFWLGGPVQGQDNFTRFLHESKQSGLALL